MAETAFMYDDGVAGKASDILNFDRFVGGGDDAMGEDPELQQNDYSFEMTGVKYCKYLFQV